MYSCSLQACFCVSRAEDGLPCSLFHCKPGEECHGNAWPWGTFSHLLSGSQLEWPLRSLSLFLVGIIFLRLFWQPALGTVPLVQNVSILKRRRPLCTWEQNQRTKGPGHTGANPVCRSDRCAEACKWWDQPCSTRTGIWLESPQRWSLHPFIKIWFSAVQTWNPIFTRTELRFGAAAWTGPNFQTEYLSQCKNLRRT